jgi:hypothetical protein
MVEQLLDSHARMRDGSDQEGHRDGQRASPEDWHPSPVEAGKDSKDDREGQHA